ncbi:hypothetical protein GS634_21935 [Ruegeria atlantica]|uniref:PRC-barrel domain protein n=1 Tax=Ruegeria atlantica TaxID=81569 RepID=A0AA91BQ89_9RHOB|nr:hypothetical protein [Ruegeria atlantica]NOE20800.1 hypothetical protein [Ruegeria atlantica]
MKLSAFLGMPVRDRTGDGTVGEVIDLAVRAGDAALTYILVNLNMTGGFDPIIFRADTLRFEEEYLVSVFSAQEISTKRQNNPSSSGSSLDLSVLPPQVIGPFGNTIAPVVIGAVLNEALQDKPHPDPPEDEYCWFRKIQGSSIFDPSGEIGVLQDIGCDFEGKSMLFLQVDNGHEVTKIPYEALRNIPGGDYLVVSSVTDPVRPV